MHPSAMDLGRLLFSTHGVGLRRVGDIGSLDVNGSLRSLCPERVEYIGIDLAPGRGVDLVLDDPYQYPFPDAHFDMMVSTSCFEHDPMFWLTFLEMLRVVRDNGIIYINAPSSGSYHTHPWDNWRFYPDASLAMEMWGRRSGYPVHALESFTMSSDPWNDYVMVFSKGTMSASQVKFLSDHIPRVTNLRKITQPGEVLFRAIETEDKRHLARLQTRVADLELSLAQPPVRNADAYPLPAIPHESDLSFGGWSGSGLAVSELCWEIPSPIAGGHVMRHRLLGEAAGPQDVFGCLIDTSLRPGGPYVASAWIWLPTEFDGRNAGLVILGRPSLNRQAIDISIRGKWQQIWVNALLGADQTAAFPRLAVDGPAGTTVYTSGWRFEHGVIPCTGA